MKATATRASFSPLPFQSYLSLALSSPPSFSMDGDSTWPAVGAKDDASAASQKTGHVYGVPPHNPDDSGAIAMERIINFFLLPPKLEGAMTFGVLACLDSWLYIFTILPLRFVQAVAVLLGNWRARVWDYLNYDGNKLRKKSRRAAGSADSPGSAAGGEKERKRKQERKISRLSPTHKADILRGMVLFISCWFLMRFDASKMYHAIRGQSGIKLYVIYNMLDVSYTVP